METLKLVEPTNLCEVTKTVTEKEIGIESAASWLIDILSSTYGRHNLSASVEQTQRDIITGRIKPFFIIEDGKPSCCAALISSKNTVEIGRAANAAGGKNGSKAMLEAVSFWKNELKDTRPLVAEIRMAASFARIAGGQGSQATLLDTSKIGMIPHAFLPTFHHPGPDGPDRQELFCFAALEKDLSARVAPQSILIPDRVEMNRGLLQDLFSLNGFNTQVVIGKSRTQTVLVNKKMQRPFNLFEISNKGENIDKFRQDRGEESPFDLIVADSFRPDISGIASSLIDEGFILSGISAPHDGPLQLLFGRLGRCILAPTEPMRNFPRLNPRFILQVDQQFRKNMR